jgi:endonuclease YncB( thermonuclease family)
MIYAGRMRFLNTILIGVVLTVFASPLSNAETISKISDGDTIITSDGQKVRLLQIDTPEPLQSECYASEATAVLEKLITGKSIRLESDPVSADIDQFKRSLRYVFVGKTNVNLRMVELGAAAPRFYNGEKGKYWRQLMKAAENAKAKKIGLWGKCPDTKLDPFRSLTTGRTGQSKPKATATKSGHCDPNYSPCIPISLRDLNCPDLYALGISSIRVIGDDVHEFDRDRDGIACENKP